MSDDLIAGAKWTLENAAGMTLEDEEVRQLCDMADRIEELELEIEIWKSRAIHQNEVAGKLEAKLAKAVEALTVIDALDPEGLINGCSQSALIGLVLRMGEIARTTLAELTGGKDE